ncbi:hypothetical protein [Cellvibrio sp. QJXJ]|uniref:hypothetical protein n=1 Tax=Cellvibrio sp. QJXJ TaxID=2964606 RepID=UPI0021C2B54D|nr:hypothetical protein [Cellvibrio sp. QJXJ]UUA74706.1 hypothetical protein NNX04_09740 [Cellvibrio sp. QJXJ]
MRTKIILSLIVSFLSALSSAESQNLNCDVGPITKKFGGSDWLVYSCGDAQNVIFVTAPGSPAMPFVFIRANGKLRGEGNGKKAYTDLAYSELKQLSSTQVEKLIEETKSLKQ